VTHFEQYAVMKADMSRTLGIPAGEPTTEFTGPAAAAATAALAVAATTAAGMKSLLQAREFSLLIRNLFVAAPQYGGDVRLQGRSSCLQITMRDDCAHLCLQQHVL
jgi:hypothetical protein